MLRHICLLLAFMALAVGLSPTVATGQIYGAQRDGGDVYTYMDTTWIKVNDQAQIPPSEASLTIARDCGCDIIVARRAADEEIAYIHRLNQWSQTITVIDSLDQYDEPVALCRGPGEDMYILVDGWAPTEGARDVAHPYIGRLQDGLPPVDVIRYMDGELTRLVDFHVWRYGPHAWNVATLERRSSGVHEWWDIGEYQMTVEDTLDRVGWRFDDPSLFPTSSYTMTSIAIAQSGDILLSSDDHMYLVNDEGDTATFGDGLGAADLEVGPDGIVYALFGNRIRRYEDSGGRILPNLMAPSVMVDLAMGDFLYTPEGSMVFIEPAPNVQVAFEQSVQEGLTSVVVETLSSRLSPAGSFVPYYAAEPVEGHPFAYVAIGTDAVYRGLPVVDALMDGSRLFYAADTGDTFRDFTVVGSIEDARGTIPRFEELPCPGGEKGRVASANSEVVLVEDLREFHDVCVYKFWRLELAMSVPDTVPPCPWGVIHDLQDHVTHARAFYDEGELGEALSELLLMNYQLRDAAGWCVPDSSDAPVGNKVASILAHSKTLMFSIKREWEEENPGGVDESSGTISLAVASPAHGECLMAIYGPTGAEVDLSVYDVAGRLVANVYEGVLPEGGTAVAWDGRNLAGEHVASGVYFARAMVGGQSASSKVVYIR